MHECVHVWKFVDFFGRRGDSTVDVGLNEVCDCVGERERECVCVPG